MENSMEPQKIKSRTTIMTQRLYFWNYGSVKESCLTLWDPMNYSPSGSSVLGILYARILQWVALSLLQVIFLTQGSNWGRLHFRQILYCLSYEGGPLGVYPNGNKNTNKRYLHPIFIAASFTRAKSWKSKCPLMDERIKKSW